MNCNSEYDERDYTIEDIMITHFINPSMFWYRISTEIPEDLCTLEQQLLKHFASNRYKEYLPKKNEIVLVFVVSESRCCRAKVEEIFEYRQAPNKYMLWAMDHGKVLSSNSKFIRQLPQDLAEKPIENVFFGGLNNMIPAKENFDYLQYKNVMKRCAKWSAESCQLFDAAVKDAYTLEFVIQRKIKNQYFGELKAAIQTNNKISINDMLIQSKGAMEEIKEFLKVLNELKLNQRPYYLTNENDTSKYNENTLKNDCAKLNTNVPVQSNIESDKKENPHINVFAVPKNYEDEDDESALNKKINEWNLGNSKFPNENIEKLRKLKTTVNENDIRENKAQIMNQHHLVSDEKPILNETTPENYGNIEENVFSIKNVESTNDSHFINANHSKENLNNIVCLNKSICKDPFNTKNLPSKSESQDDDSNIDKKSISEHSTDSVKAKMSAREKVLARVRNRSKLLDEVATKPQGIMPAGYDMRNMQTNKSDKVFRNISNNQGKSGIPELFKKENSYTQFKGQSNPTRPSTTDEDSKSTTSMTDSANNFLRKHKNSEEETTKQFNYSMETMGFQDPLSAFEIQPFQSNLKTHQPSEPSINVDVISKYETTLQKQVLNMDKKQLLKCDEIEKNEREKMSEISYPRRNSSSSSGNKFQNKSRHSSKDNYNQRNRKNNHQSQNTFNKTNQFSNRQSNKKDGFEELDEVCVPTSAIGKDSVMVHGVIPIPINKLTEAQFTPSVHNQMERLGHRAIYRVQQYCWPHLLRFNSLILVNGEKSGKTYAYLPAICSLIEMENENEDACQNEKGPLAIIVLSTRAEAEQLQRLCKHFTNKVVFCSDKQNSAESLSQILKPTDVLICTPKGIDVLEEKNKKYRWFSKDRIKHFIIENIDTWGDEKLSILSKAMDSLGIKKIDDIQFIVTSRTWTPLLSKFLKLKSFNNPLICMGAHIEAAVYANTQFILKIIKNDMKLHCVIGFLKKNYYEDEKTVILCNSSEEVELLAEEIKSISFNVSICTSQSSLDEINIVRSDWEKPAGIKRSVLICSDDILPDLGIRDAQNLVHYSLSSSWTQTCYRFSVFLKYHENKLNINDRIEVFAEPKNEPAKTLILLDESNNQHLPKLINFLDRNNIVIDETISKLIKTIEIEREKALNLEMRPFCSKFLEFGKYHITKCKGRHILTGNDAPADDLPIDGEIKFQLISVESPTIYQIRILEHKLYNSNSNLWHCVKQSNAYTSFSMRFNMYFRNSENHETYFPIVKGGICVAIEKEEFYRCKILEVNKIEINRATEYNVRAKLLDVGTTMTFKSGKLLVLPKKFAEFPFQAVEMRLLGIIPYDEEEVWDKKTALTVCKWFDEYSNNKKMINTAIVQFALANTIFVKEIIMKRELPALKNYVDKIYVKKSLIEKKMVTKDTEIENDIKRMAYEVGILMPAPPKEQLETASATENSDSVAQLNEIIVSPTEKNNRSSLGHLINKTDKNVINESRVSKIKEQWCSLIGNKFSRVTVTIFNSPDNFYIQVKDFHNDFKLKKLYTKIDNYIEDGANPIFEPIIGMNCLAKYEKYERCKVIGMASENFQMIYSLFYVDIGAVKKISPKSIFTTNEEILNMLPFQAIHCGLVGISSKTLDEHWSYDDSQTIYNKFFKNSNCLYARPMLEESPNTDSILKYWNYKIMIVDCTNKKKPMQINSQLYEKGLATRDPDSEHYMDITAVIDFDNHTNESNEISSSSSEEWEIEEDRPTFSYSQLKDEESEREFDINFDEEDIKKFLESAGFPKTTKLIPSDEWGTKENSQNKEESVSITEIKDESFTNPIVNSSPNASSESKNSEKPNEKTSNFLNSLKSTAQTLKERKSSNKYVVKSSLSKISSQRMPELKRPNASLYKRPNIIWQQSESLIILSICAPNIDSYDINVSKTHLGFSAEIDNKLNVACINLFGCVDAVSHEIRGLKVVVRLIKSIKGKAHSWPRLTNETDKHVWLKYNYESLLDESESHENLEFRKPINLNSSDEEDSSESNGEVYQTFERVHNAEDFYDPMEDL